MNKLTIIIFAPASELSQSDSPRIGGLGGGKFHDFMPSPPAPLPMLGEGCRKFKKFYKIIII